LGQGLPVLPLGLFGPRYAVKLCAAVASAGFHT
jgi:hypothetical protein